MGRVALVIFVFIIFYAGLTFCKTPIEALSGKKIDFDNLYGKSAVVLNFWATWCGPCRLELPHLQKIYEEYSPKGVVFVAVSLDNPRHKDRIANYLSKNKINMPVYIDSNGQLASRFKIQAIPATFVLAKGGKMVYQAKGYRPGDEILLRKQIDSLLQNEKQAEKP